MDSSSKILQMHWEKERDKEYIQYQLDRLTKAVDDLLLVFGNSDLTTPQGVAEALKNQGLKEGLNAALTILKENTNDNPKST